MLTLRTADIVHFQDKIFYPTSYPSEFSDLIESAAHSNVTIVASDGGSIIDGKLLTGGVLYYLENQRRFTWAKFQDFTFRHFSKLIMSRQHSWSTFPQMVFQNCIFEDNTYDLFSTSGGHWIFINCVFRNNSGRIFKALSETLVEFVDCHIETSQAAFAYGADIIFRNCIFSHTFGSRGGALYASKSTVYVNKCKFIETNATANGGAIYIRDSHEKYQSEISDSCFLNTHAEMNGTAIYSYLSDLDIHGNIFSGGKEMFYQYTSEIHEKDNIFNGNAEECIQKHQPLNEEDQFQPCDTYQNHATDDAHGNIFLDFSNPEDPLEEIMS